MACSLEIRGADAPIVLNSFPWHTQAQLAWWEFTEHFPLVFCLAKGIPERYERGLMSLRLLFWLPNLAV